jgi:hypothetical protein
VTKPTAQQYAAARILTSEWHASLTHAIESRRGKARALTGFFVESEKLALVVAHVVTKLRKDDEPPSPLSVAQEIGQLLGASDRTGEAAGAALLGMAQTCGFIDIKDGERRPGWQAAKEIRLSIPAEAQRADIEARLAASEIAPERPLLERPPVEVIITPNKDDIDPPLQPLGLAVAEALDPIQSTAWRVNRFILDTLLKLKVPEKAALAQAKQYADAPEFWYRCTFDWRGRLFQRGGRLQYTSGTDAARSLLEFAHGEPLTADGYAWLSSYLATCYGVPGPFTDRTVWTHGNESDIRHAAADPIGSTFWREAKQPYRFLAACHAWVAAWSGQPVHLPVAADATSSIFQHYAWLLRDEELGAKVNLAPATVGSRPVDIYGSIAQKRTVNIVKLPKGAGIVQLHTGGFTRSEVKAQAWMFYGEAPWAEDKRPWLVQRHAAIQRLLKAQAPRAWALYLALRRAAKYEAEAGRALEWTLPDHFRVRQANRNEHSRKTEIWLHGWNGAWRLQARRRELLESLNINDQVKGLPPNLIHSLDACLLRAVVREASSVSRWAVAHDSIGVHPNDGGRLRSAIVEAIECVYGPDVLASLGAWCDGIPAHAAELPATMRGGWYTFS